MIKETTINDNKEDLKQKSLTIFGLNLSDHPCSYCIICCLLQLCNMYNFKSTQRACHQNSKTWHTLDHKLLAARQPSCKYVISTSGSTKAASTHVCRIIDQIWRFHVEKIKFNRFFISVHKALFLLLLFSKLDVVTSCCPWQIEVKMVYSFSWIWVKFWEEEK
jgi:hypothetical protein